MRVSNKRTGGRPVNIAGPAEPVVVGAVVSAVVGLVTAESVGDGVVVAAPGVVGVDAGGPAVVGLDVVLGRMRTETRAARVVAVKLTSDCPVGPTPTARSAIEPVVQHTDVRRAIGLDQV